MNHGRHTLPYTLAALVAIMLFVTLGGNPLAAGIGFAFLLCPLVMGVVMWLLMRQPRGSTPTAQLPDRHDYGAVEQASTDSRR